MRGMHSSFEQRVPRIVSVIAALVGALILAEVILRRDGSADRFPMRAGVAAEAVAVLSGWALLRLSRGLNKRKRAEWRIALMACVTLLLTDLLRAGHRPVEITLTAALLGTLVVGRRQFAVVGDPGGRWFAVRAAAQLLAVGFVLGLIMLYMPGHVAGSVSIWARLREVSLSVVGLGGGLEIAGHTYADVLHTTLMMFGVAAVVTLVTIGLRASQPVAALTDCDEQRLRTLLSRHGDRDSLGYFALRRDKAVVWSASGKAALTYRVVRGVALASADPLGDPEAWPGAIGAWRDLVAHHGWTPAVIGCSERGALAYRRYAGLNTIALGDEAVVDASAFTLDGRAMRGVRQASARIERAGYVVEVHRASELSTTCLAELRAASEAWRTDAVERGFSMALSRLGDAADGECLIVTARLGGCLRGLLHFVPWGDVGISLDLMRRDRTADNGLNELMIASLLQACPARGIKYVSLNFAMFRDALERGGRLGAGPVSRLWRQVLLIASRWWQIDSLYSFNDKFRPAWQPRYFSYSRVRDLPRIALATLEAEAFVVPPPTFDRLVGRATSR